MAGPPQALRLPSRSAWRVWGSRFLAAIVLALAFGYLPYRVLGEQGLARAFRLEEEERAQRVRIRKLEEENVVLRRELRGLRSDLEAVEGVARDQLGMVKADEIVFQLEGLSAGSQPRNGRPAPARGAP